MPSDTFNINHPVKVKLTDRGREIYQDHYTWPPREDEAGYVTMQLWHVMEVFGDHISLGCTLPIETEIILCDD